MLEGYYDFLTSGLNEEMHKDLVAVDITPAAQWFLEESMQEFWNYREDFPSILPPWPVAWVEYEMPRTIRSEERVVENHQAKRAGLLSRCLELEPEDRAEILRADGLLRLFGQTVAESYGVRRLQLGSSERQKNIDYHLEQRLLPKWILIWHIVIEPITLRELIPLACYAMYLDESGQILNGLGCAFTPLPMGEMAQEEQSKAIYADTLPFMFALSLMHCKNVKIFDNPVPPKVAKKRRERGQPDITYKMLNIVPVRKQSAERPQGQTGDSVQRALHIVRGHFKTYSEDKPLFGRHVGTYFWHMAARGSGEAGKIVKQYRVQPAPQEAVA